MKLRANIGWEYQSNDKAGILNRSLLDNLSGYNGSPVYKLNKFAILYTLLAR